MSPPSRKAAHTPALTKDGVTIHANRLPDAVSMELRPEVMERYTGTYDYGNGAVMTIRKDESKPWLRAQLNGQPSLRIYPKSQTLFRWKKVEAEMEFVSSDDGQTVTGAIQLFHQMIRFLMALAIAVSPSQMTAQTPKSPPVQREIREVSGWKVHISRKLLDQEPAATAVALTLLQTMLNDIARRVPAAAVVELQKVPLYFSPIYPGHRGGAEFHPDAGWLKSHGRDPVMARGVEFSNIPIFAQEMNRMPNFALHELAHAYHFRVLPDGFANSEIREAYDRAKASGSYDRVERWHGNGHPNTFERAYAMTNPQEYFAETSEAFFARNDFFPFTGDELKKHDPRMFELLSQLWGRVIPLVPRSPEAPPSWSGGGREDSEIVE